MALIRNSNKEDKKTRLLEKRNSNTGMASSVEPLFLNKKA